MPTLKAKKVGGHGPPDSPGATPLCHSYVYQFGTVFLLAGQIPQFGYCDEVDMTNIVKLKSRVKEQLLQKGINFSYMPFIIKAVSTALHHFPILNSHTDPECTTVTYKADHNIGVAMDMPQGLVVPNIKQCQVRN